jgi:hypothetical protein
MKKRPPRKQPKRKLAKKPQRKQTTDYWKSLIRTTKKPTHRKKPKTMPKKARAEAEETQPADASEEAAPLTEETLPPPDPPVVPSEPTEPPAPDAVDDSEKGAHPEVAAIRELNITPESTPGEGPVPGPPTTVEPQEKK